MPIGGVAATVLSSETPTRKLSSDEAERHGLFRLFQTATKFLNCSDRITDRSRQSSPSIALGSVEVGVSDGLRVVGFERLKVRVQTRIHGGERSIMIPPEWGLSRICRGMADS